MEILCPGYQEHICREKLALGMEDSEHYVSSDAHQLQALGGSSAHAPLSSQSLLPFVVIIFRSVLRSIVNSLELIHLVLPFYETNDSNLATKIFL